jgi:hypothetical protein
MPDADVAELQARVCRLENVVAVLVDALDKVAPHLPVLVSMEFGAMADEARAMLRPDSIDLTAGDE